MNAQRRRIPGVGPDLLSRLGFADDATALLQKEVCALREHAAAADKRIEALTRALRALRRSESERSVRARRAPASKRGARG